MWRITHRRVGGRPVAKRCVGELLSCKTPAGILPCRRMAGGEALCWRIVHNGKPPVSKTPNGETPCWRTALSANRLAAKRLSANRRWQNVGELPITLSSTTLSGAIVQWLVCQTHNPEVLDSIPAAFYMPRAHHA